MGEFYGMVGGLVGVGGRLGAQLQSLETSTLDKDVFQELQVQNVNLSLSCKLLRWWVDEYWNIRI